MNSQDGLVHSCSAFVLSEVSVDTELPKLENVPLKKSCIKVGCVPIQIWSQQEGMFYKAAKMCDLLYTMFSLFSSKSLFVFLLCLIIQNHFDNIIKNVESCNSMYIFLYFATYFVLIYELELTLRSVCAQTFKRTGHIDYMTCVFSFQINTTPEISLPRNC